MNANTNANALPFSASTFSRRGMATTGPGPATGVPDFAEGGVSAGPKSTQTAPGGIATGASAGPDTNPLNRLTEEQREEINEAVRYKFQVTLDIHTRTQKKLT